ncbi:MAG: DUF975 family protein [Clostridia bacterium]
MKTNKEIRKLARNTVKKNYFVLVFICIIMMLLAGMYTTTFNGIKNLLREDFKVESQNINFEIDSLSNSNLDITGEVLTLIFNTDDIEQLKFKESVTGGLFRTIFDGVTHAEQFLFRIVKYVVDLFVTAKKTITLGIIIILIQLIYRIFVAKPLKVCQARVFMESRIYYKTPFKRYIDVINKKDYINVVKTIFITDIYQLLWDFTIIGGIIKRYSYRLVPMIMAENPSIKPKEAIDLSKQMMNGNKLRLLKLDLSFIIYQILDILTLGLFGILFSNPYYTASIVEFYTDVKVDYKESKKENSELLNDPYLIENSQGFECYPGVKRRELKNADEIFKYYQKYSVTSLILMFFTFSFFGWLWEVGIYLFKDGRFVNRGTMQGPWLPIYGTGCLVILFLLFLPKKYKKITDNPILTFFIVVLLCGTIEYSTSWYLEATHGMRWWDYTGYFLNINGRVCFEGLMFFGIGGCLSLYVIAPNMQKLISKIPRKLREAICVILVILFLADSAYSSINPNVGAGITDDGDRNIVEQIEN